MDETYTISVDSTNELLLPVVEKIVLLENLNISDNKIKNILSSFDAKLNSICCDTLVRQSRTDDDRFKKRRLEFETLMKDADRDGKRRISKSKYDKRRSRSAIRPRSIIRPSSLSRRSKSAIRMFPEINRPEQPAGGKITPVSETRKSKCRKIYTPNENVNITRKSLRSFKKQKNESQENSAESSFDVSSILCESHKPFIQKQANNIHIFSPYATVRSNTRISAISTPK